MGVWEYGRKGAPFRFVFSVSPWLDNLLDVGNWTLEVGCSFAPSSLGSAFFALHST